MKTAHKTTLVDPLKQLVLFFNPFPIVYFHNLSEREENRLGKEVNKAELRESRNLNPWKSLTGSLPEGK